MNRDIFQSLLKKNFFACLFGRIYHMHFIDLPSSVEMQMLKCLDPMNFNKAKN